MKIHHDLSSDYFDYIKDKLKDGDVLEDKGFISTSTDEEVTGRFGNWTMEILIPKGSRANSVKHLSGVEDEDKVLLDAGLKFEVSEINNEKISCIIGTRLIEKGSFIRNKITKSSKVSITFEDFFLLQDNLSVTIHSLVSILRTFARAVVIFRVKSLG